MRAKPIYPMARRWNSGIWGLSAKDGGRIKGIDSCHSLMQRERHTMDNASRQTRITVSLDSRDYRFLRALTNGRFTPITRNTL